MSEKSNCRSRTLYWWKLVVETSYWSPFFPRKEIFKSLINFCFLTKNLELAETVVLLEVLYRLVDWVYIYDFIHLLTYYQLCINFQKNITWKWIVFNYCGFFVCVYKAKIWFIWWRKCLNRRNLFLFFPHYLWECFVFFYLIWKPLVTVQRNDHYYCNVVDFHWVFNSLKTL